MENMPWDDSKYVYFYFSGAQMLSYIFRNFFFKLCGINGKRVMPIAICPCDAVMCNATSSGCPGLENQRRLPQWAPFCMLHRDSSFNSLSFICPACSFFFFLLISLLPQFLQLSVLTSMWLLPCGLQAEGRYSEEWMVE